MIKLILLLLISFVFACGNTNSIGGDKDNSLDSIGDSLLIDSSKVDSISDSLLIDDSSKVESTTFEDDSLAFLNIKVSQKEKVVVKWETYPDTNVESYVVYYKLGAGVTLQDESILCDKDANSLEIIKEKFIPNSEYSFIVVANIYDGSQSKKVISNAEMFKVAGNSSSTEDSIDYVAMELDKILPIEIDSISDVKGYEVLISKAGNYAVTFSTETSGFYPSVIIYNEDKSQKIGEGDGLDDIDFTASEKVLIEVSIKGDYYKGSAFMKIITK